MTTPSSEELYNEANRDAVESPYRVTVIYGDIGSRKTTVAASLVKDKGLLLSTDGSWESLLNPRHAEIYKKLKITPVDAISQFKHIDFDNGYDTVIWDTASETVDTFLDLMYDEADWAGKIRENIVTKNPELKKLKVQSLGAMDYRVTRDTLRPVFNRLFFSGLTSHIVITSQVKKPMAGLSQDTQMRPDIPAATFKIIGVRATLIGHTKPVSGKYVIDFTNNLTQLGKTRIEGIEGSMDHQAFITKYKERVFK